jgi:DNA modification methylase
MTFIVGNCVDVLKTISNKFDFIYMDPPYNTGRDWFNFDDRFQSPKDYIENLIEPMLLSCKEVMNQNSTIAIHIEPKCSHWIKICAEQIFGELTNEIVWVTGGNKNSSKKLQRNHDTILIYTQGKSKFNPQFVPYSEDLVKRAKICRLTNKKYTTSALINRQPNIVPRPNLRYEWNGHSAQWWVSKEKMQKLHDEGKLEYSKSGIPRIKKYLSDMKGIQIKDTWNDIPILQGKEKLSYATQKPVALLERLIKLYTDEGDFVLDPCAGSGTTGRACLNLNRNFTLIDINKQASDVFYRSIMGILPV